MCCLCRGGRALSPGNDFGYLEGGKVSGVSRWGLQGRRQGPEVLFSLQSSPKRGLIASRVLAPPCVGSGHGWLFYLPASSPGLSLDL